MGLNKSFSKKVTDLNQILAKHTVLPSDVKGNITEVMLPVISVILRNITARSVTLEILFFFRSILSFICPALLGVTGAARPLPEHIDRGIPEI